MFWAEAFEGQSRPRGWADSGLGREDFAARREGLEQLLAGWSPEQHTDFAHLLDRLSRALMGEDADRHLISR